MLRVNDLHSGYGQVPVLHGVSLEVKAGELVCLLGSNGAGKSTLLKCVMGTARPFAGRVHFDGREITGLPTPEVVRRGIVYVPEGKMVFGSLTVEENLRLGAYLVAERQALEDRMAQAFDLFPRLLERRGQRAGTLSGGEQTMLALARGLMAGPRLLMLDEPSLGLMPKLVTEVLGTISRLRQSGLALLLVEQRAREALAIADRGYVLRTGRMVAQGTRDQLLTGNTLREAMLSR